MKKGVLVFLLLTIGFVHVQSEYIDCWPPYDYDYAYDYPEIVYLPPEKIRNIIDFLNKVSTTPKAKIITERTVEEVTTTSEPTTTSTEAPTKPTEPTTTSTEATTKPTEQTTSTEAPKKPTEPTTTSTEATTEPTEQTTSTEAPKKPTEPTTTSTEATTKPTEQTTTSTEASIKPTETTTTSTEASTVQEVEDPIEDLADKEIVETATSVKVESELPPELKDDYEDERDSEEDILSLKKKSEKMQELTATTPEDENDSKPKNVYRWLRF